MVSLKKHYTKKLSKVSSNPPPRKILFYFKKLLYHILDKLPKTVTNSLSLTTTPIVLYKNEIPISLGTGFFYKTNWGREDRVFLITNYHVITGNATDKRSQKPVGDSIRFYLHMNEDNPQDVLVLKVPLFTDGNQQVWLDHINPVVDVVAIPILFTLPVKLTFKTVDKGLADTDMDISVTDSVTLIGYPHKFLDKKNALPIYKTGNIASEYEYDFENDPCFLIDISAFSGNSGSPAFSIRKNAQIVSDQIVLKAKGSLTKFLGIYSAGIIHKEFMPIVQNRKSQQGVFMDGDMQLGVVWRANVLEEIINAHSYKEYVAIAKKWVKTKGFRYTTTKGLQLP